MHVLFSANCPFPCLPACPTVARCACSCWCQKLFDWPGCAIAGDRTLNGGRLPGASAGCCAICWSNMCNVHMLVVEGTRVQLISIISLLQLSAANRQWRPLWVFGNCWHEVSWRGCMSHDMPTSARCLCVVKHCHELILPTLLTSG